MVQASNNAPNGKRHPAGFCLHASPWRTGRRRIPDHAARGLVAPPAAKRHRAMGRPAARTAGACGGDYADQCLAEGQCGRWCQARVALAPVARVALCCLATFGDEPGSRAGLHAGTRNNQEDLGQGGVVVGEGSVVCGFGERDEQRRAERESDDFTSA